jgi:hypothetical protein
MKRLLILLVVLGLLTAFPAAALADKPDCSIPDSTHPSCGDGEPDGEYVGTECTESTKLGDDMLVDATDTDFLLTVDAINPNACIDVSKVAASGTWSIEFNVVSGTLRELIVSVRDSVAGGDLCDEARLRRPIERSGRISLQPNAADFVNACGTQYGEIVPDGTTYTTYTTVEPGIQSPLAFLVWARGKDLEINFWVDYPNG